MPLRRAKSQPALTAAAARIQLSNRQLAKRVVGSSQQWQKESWESGYDGTPEVMHAVDYVGNNLGKVRWYVGLAPDGPIRTAQPIDDPDAKLAGGAVVPSPLVIAAKSELARLGVNDGGLGELIQRGAQNLDVGGEVFLIALGARLPVTNSDGTVTPEEPEHWYMASRDEYVAHGDGFAYKADAGDTAPQLLDPATDIALRIWYKHPRWAQQCTSPVRALMTDIRALDMLSKKVVGDAMSGMNAGLILIPSTLTLEKRKRDPDVEGDSAAEADEDSFLADFEAMLIDPIENLASPQAVVPGVLRGPKEDLEGVKVITFARQSGEEIEAKIIARVERIGRGLQVPVEVVMGHRDTTFDNAAQIDEDTYSKYFEPRLDIFSSALTTAFLQVQLAVVYGFAPDLVRQVIVAYDPSDLVSTPSTEENAPDAQKDGTISHAARRRATGFTEEDAPTLLERAVDAALSGKIDVQLAAAILQKPLAEEGVILPQPSATLMVSRGAGVPTETVGPSGVESNPSPAQPIPVAPAAPGIPPPKPPTIPTPSPPTNPTPPATSTPTAILASSRRTRGDLSRKLVDVDRDVRGRLLVASSAAMERAVERAGNRIRQRAGTNPVTRAALRNVPACDVGQHVMGDVKAAMLASRDDLIGDAWAQLHEQWSVWVGNAQAQALDTVSRFVSGLSTAERTSYTLRQAHALEDGWDWLKGALDKVAVHDLFDGPDVAAAAGEIDASLHVPPSAIRSAMAIAGGDTKLLIPPAKPGSLSGAFVAVPDPNGFPPGGIGNGPIVTEALAAHGVRRESFVWVYGPAHRSSPFEPHVQLDGQVFTDFAELAVTGGFPESSNYYPGDHDGCVCDFSVVYLAPGEDA